MEPVHALLYYAPEVFAEAETLGYNTETRWPSYFAWRSAPLGVAGAELVAATFYSFNPSMVRSHVPAAWQVATPSRVLSARSQAVDKALRSILKDDVNSPEVTEAATLARELAESASTVARPLGAANAELPWPAEPHLVLWQAITTLRELRGDGHVAALVTAGLDPVESLVSFAAIGAAPKEVFASRGWPEQEWTAARDRLTERGWVAANGAATEAGHAGRAEIERLTDELAAPPYRAMGADRIGRLAQLVMPIMLAVVKTGILPNQSTLGINRT